MQVYRVEDEGRRYSRLGRCAAQSAAFLPGLEWSRDSQHLQLNTAEREPVVVMADLCRLLGEPDEVMQ